MYTTAPQLGHFPFFPAAEAGVRTGQPHWAQGNSILSAAAGLRLPPSDVAATVATNSFPAVSAAVSDCHGIDVTAPQWGHFPFLPAVLSGVRIGRRQVEHLNSIGMSTERLAGDNLPAERNCIPFGEAHKTVP